MRAMGPSASVRTVPGVRRKRVRGCHFPQGCPRTVTWLCGFAWKRHAWGMCARMQRVCARLGTAGNFGTVLLGVLDCAPFVSHPRWTSVQTTRVSGWGWRAARVRCVRGTPGEQRMALLGEAIRAWSQVAVAVAAAAAVVAGSARPRSAAEG